MYPHHDPITTSTIVEGLREVWPVAVDVIGMEATQRIAAGQTEFADLDDGSFFDPDSAIRVAIAGSNLLRALWELVQRVMPPKRDAEVARLRGQYLHVLTPAEIDRALEFINRRRA